MRFWPFRRKPQEPPVPDRRRMAEDWRIGDLAIMRDDAGQWPTTPCPVPERTYRVTDIRDEIATAGDAGARYIFLLFREFPNNGWSNTAFRKAQADHEPATESLSEMIRRHSKQPQEV